jgi:glycosyltransferase involved in cell wall biosynthesis
VLEIGSRNPILVIVAALNGEEGIGLTIADFKKHVEKPWIMVVDGKSQDRTVEVAKSMDAEIIVQRGSGKGNAVTEAIRHVDVDVDYAILTDADYTYPAEYVPQMLRILERNPQVGMVCGNRFSPTLDAEAIKNVFNVGNRLLAFAHNMLNGVSLRDPLTGLRMIRWEIMERWIPKSQGFDIEVELNHRVENKGFGIVEIPIHYRERLGEKKLKAKHGLTILRRILSESIGANWTPSP